MPNHKMNKFSMFCFLSIFAVHSFAQESSAVKDTEDILNQFVLVRPLDYAEGCFDSARADALLIFTATTPPMMIGTPYQIITNSGHAIAGSLEEIVPADSCGGLFTEMTSALSFGLLHVATKVYWDNSFGAMIAIPSNVRSPENIGTVSDLRDTLLQNECKALIRPLVPIVDHFDIETMALITAPDTHKKYLFIGVERILESEMKYHDDKAFRYTGFLFYYDRKVPQLLIQEDGLEGIFTISDLDRDGEYEIGFSSGNALTVGYGVRIFDGKTFKGPGRVLYQAGD